MGFWVVPGHQQGHVGHAFSIDGRGTAALGCLYVKRDIGTDQDRIQKVDRLLHNPSTFLPTAFRCGSSSNKCEVNDFLSEGDSPSTFHFFGRFRPISALSGKSAEIGLQ